MDKGKLIAIITGAISIILAVIYLVLVQILDSRGEMLPAPISMFWIKYYLISIFFH